MATYADLGLENYAQLSTDAFAQLVLNETSTSEGSCIWTNALISALQTAIGNLEAKIDLLAEAMVKLQTHGDSRWNTAEGFATPEDVQLSTTTQTVEVISQTVDLSSVATLTNQQTILNELGSLKTSADAIPEKVWNYGEDYTSRSVKANGVSLESSELTVNIDSAEIANCVWSNTSRTLTSGENIDFPEFNTSDLAKSADLEDLAKKEDLTHVAKSAELADLAKISDLSGLATSAGVEAAANAVPEKVWNYGEDYTSRTVKANGVSLESTELSVNIDSAEIANRVWSNTSRTLTSGENIDFPEFNTSDLAKAEQVENVAKVSDLADLAKSADIVQVQEDVINIQNTMADVFPKILNSQQLQVGLLGHWKVEEDVLVIFDENGDKISEILLTKDKKGNIIQMGSTQE
ncbi:MAG: hypothetical protein IJV91_05735 [Kiritimatiellae bacterium]|nr:hypothetical protein [Kiritimatiellia bacterium]